MSTTNFSYRCKKCGALNNGKFKTFKDKMRVGPPICTGVLGVQSSGMGAAMGQAAIQGIGALLIMITFVLLLYTNNTEERSFTKQVCKKCQTDNTDDLHKHFGG
jgi:ribosomal protein L40E